ncbi:MAG: DUF4450 domain-containing protein [Bacteroidota bacterium]|nr:DUF4450 domain-containing protein [Bacteroidota bacterium]
MRLIFIFLFIVSVFPAMGWNGLWHGKERTLRYMPDGDDFVIVNGKVKYNRALYGTNTAFRAETGDVPEFAFYLPGMGGNLHFGLVVDGETKWLNDAQFVEARYRAGSRLYTIKDPLLGDGELHLTALAMADTEGFVLRGELRNCYKKVELVAVFGGATGKRFSREGDLGVDAADCFDLKPEYCTGNKYLFGRNDFQLTLPPTKKSAAITLTGIFPESSVIKAGNPTVVASPFAQWNSSVANDQPVVMARFEVIRQTPFYVAVVKDNKDNFLSYKKLEAKFVQAEAARQQLASRVKITTPDPFINTLGGTLAIAADAIWEPNSYLHGAIGWRMRLAGWRGAYTGDVLGWHDRSRLHFNDYAASQVTDVPNTIPHPAQDSALHLARALKQWGTPMYSNGYICRNPQKNNEMHHYDMNLCYIDELLWHFNWTGDLDYVKKMWPVLKLSLAWEKRNFDPNDDGLYDGYAAIWASDGLQYNSGAATHSTAYNYRDNKMAAEIARKIGEDPIPYEQEAAKIWTALNKQLWMSGKGVWAEYKDFMGNKGLHASAAVWSVYHTVDSEAGDPFQFYQATRYVDTQIPHIPVKAKGLKDEGWETISTSDWMPYCWSTNNVAFAEVWHTALSYWQSGRRDAAFKLFKSSVIDGMYLGASPGNVGQISFYDAARGECYRDFGDPIGMFTRALVQGLFGILPDALNDRLVIRPGMPTDWKFASFSTPDISIDYKRNGNVERYNIGQHLPKLLNLELHLKAYSDKITRVSVNRKPAAWRVDTTAVGTPAIWVMCGKYQENSVEIEWGGKSVNTPEEITVAHGDTYKQTLDVSIGTVYDPQSVLGNKRTDGSAISGTIKGEVGHRTFFVRAMQGDLMWWMPVGLWVKEPLAVQPVNSGSGHLSFCLLNNRGVAVTGKLLVNGEQIKGKQTIAAASVSEQIEVPVGIAVFGTNCISFVQDNGQREELTLVDWTLPVNAKERTEVVNIDNQLNDRVTQIFKNEYLAPRSPYTTLQTPTQGIGEWTHPLTTAVIDDSGLRKASENGIFNTPMGVPFRTASLPEIKNIAFTSLWNNYPASVTVPLTEKASHAYLLMAGSTNHMQSRFTNGVVKVWYADGTSDSLSLVNPQTWCPIEQDYYEDGFAFNMQAPRPYRVFLKTGAVSREMMATKEKQATDATKRNGGDYTETPVSPASGREIDGGAAVILDLPLNRSKQLKQLTLETRANEVVIGLMAVTLIR